MVAKTRRFVLGLLVVACLGAGEPALKGWGIAVDSDKDCRFEQKGDALTIAIPNTEHNLTTTLAKLNAPRVLSPVRGDFIATVKASGNVQPSDPPSNPNALPYLGAGLLLWGDDDHFVRLERAGLISEGQFVTYANFEVFVAGKQVSSNTLRLENRAVELRFERRGTKLYASFSHDGVFWVGFPPVDLTMPDVTKIGVAAISTSAKPFNAEFSEYRVYTLNKGM